MLESKVETRLREKTEKLKGKCVKLVAIGKDRGIPDRLLILPGGLNIYVELKAPGKVPSKQQIHRHKELRDLGQEVLVIDTLEQVDDLMDDLEAYISTLTNWPPKGEN